jgi:hypothetical protein
LASSNRCRKALFGPAESLLVRSLGKHLQVTLTQFRSLSNLAESVEQDHSQRYELGKQGLFGGAGLPQIAGIRVRQKYLATPLTQSQSLVLGHGDELFVFALGHLRTNGSISQLIGWHGRTP